MAADLSAADHVEEDSAEDREAVECIVDHVTDIITIMVLQFTGRDGTERIMADQDASVVRWVCL